MDGSTPVSTGDVVTEAEAKALKKAEEPVNPADRAERRSWRASALLIVVVSLLWWGIIAAILCLSI